MRDEFIDQFISEANIDSKWAKAYREFLAKMNNQDMVNEMIGGTKKIDLDPTDKSDYPFITDPLPNILFQRDPFASVGEGIILNRMWSVTRNRETLFPDFVFHHHQAFKGDLHFWYSRDEKNPIEGGDVLVLNDQTLIIGISQRTSMDAVKIMAERLFAKSSYQRILAIDLPISRSFMHLDTVFTNIDYDKFIVHPLIFDNIAAFKLHEITRDGVKDINKGLIEVLEEYTGKKVTLIKCGGDDPIAAGREQWNDGTNVLTIAPGKVIAYERNWVTIDLLKKAGVEVLLIPSSELSRGRGGPRCMSMPLQRKHKK